MFGISAFKTIVGELARPFVFVGSTVRYMCAVIKAKVVRQCTHRADLVAFGNAIDIEAAGEKWVEPQLSCPAHAVISKSTKTGNFDIEASFPEVIKEGEPPRYKPTLNGPRDNIPSPPSLSAEKIEEPDKDWIYTPIYYRGKSYVYPTPEMLKTSTRNARVGCARSQRHSILFGDRRKPGLVTLVAGLPNNSSNTPDIFARPESQRECIHHTRAIHHRILIDKAVEIPSSVSEEVEVAIAAAVVPEVLVTVTQAPTQPDATTIECGPDSMADACNSSYVTVGSSDDLCTPPYTPTGRARIVQSGSYGGLINYSLCRSRDADEFDIIMDCMNKLHRETTDLVGAHATEDSSLGF